MDGTYSGSWSTTAFGTEGISLFGSTTGANYDVSYGHSLGMGDDKIVLVS